SYVRWAGLGWLDIGRAILRETGAGRNREARYSTFGFTTKARRHEGTKDAKDAKDAKGHEGKEERAEGGSPRPLRLCRDSTSSLLRGPSFPSCLRGETGRR